MALQLRRICPAVGKLWARQENMTMLQDRGAMLTGLGIGLGLMYFLDPERHESRGDFDCVEA
jgi:hypothetical protein